MSIIYKKVRYTRINDTSTAVVGTNDGSYGAVPTSYEGEVIIYPIVRINNIQCTVTEIGYRAFYQTSKITNIIIPDTIVILRESSFIFFVPKKPIMIPSSVKTVETYFIEGANPEIIFCGVKEPSMVNTREDYYISDFFLGSVMVPYNYEVGKETFCKKKIERKSDLQCSTIPKYILYVKNECNTCKIKRRNIQHLILVIIISS